MFSSDLVKVLLYVYARDTRNPDHVILDGDPFEDGSILEWLGEYLTEHVIAATRKVPEYSDKRIEVWADNLVRQWLADGIGR